MPLCLSPLRLRVGARVARFGMNVRRILGCLSIVTVATASAPRAAHTMPWLVFLRPWYGSHKGVPNIMRRRRSERSRSPGAFVRRAAPLY